MRPRFAFPVLMSLVLLLPVSTNGVFESGLDATSGVVRRGHVQQKSAAVDPRIVIETAKGTIDVRLFATDAPKSVEHVLGLVKRSFYRGLRVHRVTPSLVQFGDPLTRDMSRKSGWGSGGSGRPIGLAEISRKHTHQRGTVALAHGGSPTMADSQIYIMKSASPGLDGKHTIIGQVVSGMAVVDTLVVPDLIRQVSLK